MKTVLFPMNNFPAAFQNEVERNWPGAGQAGRQLEPAADSPAGLAVGCEIPAAGTGAAEGQTGLAFPQFISRKHCTLFFHVKMMRF